MKNRTKWMRMRVSAKDSHPTTAIIKENEDRNRGSVV